MPNWGTTEEDAMAKLPLRFPNIRTVTCSPDTDSATGVASSGDRIWNRHNCTGVTYGGVEFGLTFESTGGCADCWTVFRLTGVTAAALKTRATKTSATPKRPAPSTPTKPANSDVDHYVSESEVADSIRREDLSNYDAATFSKIHFDTVVCSGQAWRGARPGKYGEKLYAYFSCQAIATNDHIYRAVVNTKGPRGSYWLPEIPADWKRVA
jgi:hypothetical protein